MLVGSARAPPDQRRRPERRRADRGPARAQRGADLVRPSPQRVDGMQLAGVELGCGPREEGRVEHPDRPPVAERVDPERAPVGHPPALEAERSTQRSLPNRPDDRLLAEPAAEDDRCRPAGQPEAETPAGGPGRHRRLRRMSRREHDDSPGAANLHCDAHAFCREREAKAPGPGTGERAARLRRAARRSRQPGDDHQQDQGTSHCSSSASTSSAHLRASSACSMPSLSRK